MTLSFVIRKYQDDGRGQCRALWRELTEWHREIYQDSTIGGQHPEDYFDKHLATVGPGQIWVVVCDSEVVGLIGLVVKVERAKVESVIVSKAYCRKGIGTKFMETAVSRATINRQGTHKLGRFKI